MGLRLEIRGVNEVRAALQRFEELIDDFDPLWDKYSEIMASVEAQWFETQGEGSWPPLAASTVKRKASAGYRSRGIRGPFPPDPLIATGKLVSELTDPVQAGEVGQGRSTLGTFTRNVFSWGTDDDVAEYHWTGRTRNNFMPARPPIQWPPSPATMARLAEADREFADEVIRESGLGA